MAIISIVTHSGIVSNQENVQANVSVHSIDTRNKHHLCRPNANLSCFQKVHSVLAAEFLTVYRVV
jgi:hypothetical protein